MEGPSLGPGGEDIAWPDQVAPRGQKASSTRLGRQQLAPPGLAQRSHPLALPPAKPATATAPAPTQEAAQVTAQTVDAREWGGDSVVGHPP